MAEPAFSQYGAIRGFTRFSISEKEESATSVQLGQTIVEYPPGNATKAYAEFIAQTKNSDMTLYNITMSSDLGIGQRSSILVISDRAGTAKPITMLVFAKSNIMESVTMISPTSDLTALTRVGNSPPQKFPELDPRRVCTSRHLRKSGAFFQSSFVASVGLGTFTTSTRNTDFESLNSRCGIRAGLSMSISFKTDCFSSPISTTPDPSST